MTDQEMTLGQALRAIAERTPFRTEDEQRAVLATIDRENEADARYAERLGDDSEPGPDEPDASDAPAAPDASAEPAKQPAKQQPAKRGR